MERWRCSCSTTRRSTCSGREAFEALTRGSPKSRAPTRGRWSGAPRASVFTGGADVNVFDGTTPEHGGEMFAALVAGVRRLEALPIPTLALVHGLCLTAGLEVSLGCDLIWATESAQFGLVEAVVGLTPGAGGTQRMAERAGPGRAREFVMTGASTTRRPSSAGAWSTGWSATTSCSRRGCASPTSLAAGPTKAHGATKRLVRAYLEGGVDKADAETPEVSGGLFATEDLQNAVRSFLDEGPGKATFEGR